MVTVAWSDVAVVAGGDASALLEPVEAAFDDVAPFVELLVEDRWSAAAAAAAAAPAAADLLVGAFGDGVPDAASA